MNKKFKPIYERFFQDMKKSGILILPPRENLWKSPSFSYNIWVGLYKDQASEREIPDLTITACKILFNADRSNKIMREENNHYLFLPGHIEGAASSLKAMVDGTRLITTLDSWAHHNGKLVNIVEDMPDSKNAIGKKFIFNEHLSRI